MFKKDSVYTSDYKIMTSNSNRIFMDNIYIHFNGILKTLPFTVEILQSV
jgi:hypothetical protein